MKSNYSYYFTWLLFYYVLKDKLLTKMEIILYYLNYIIILKGKDRIYNFWYYFMFIEMYNINNK